MRVFFLGVGEACDAWQPNTSLLVHSTDQYILFDCGFTTPHRYFRYHDQADLLDGLWISHFHGDHFFGVPLLLLRFWEMGRSKPLTVIGQAGTCAKVQQALELAYPGFGAKLGFQLDCLELAPGRELAALGGCWQAAATRHSQPCLAVRFAADRSLFYSGDGRPSPESAALTRGCDLVVHEAFRQEDREAGHGSVGGCLELARRMAIERLALVHLERRFRAEQVRRLRAELARLPGIEVLLPESGDELEV